MVGDRQGTGHFQSDLGAASDWQVVERELPADSWEASVCGSSGAVECPVSFSASRQLALQCTQVPANAQPLAGTPVPSIGSLGLALGRNRASMPSACGHVCIVAACRLVP